MQRVAGVEDVVHQQNVAVGDVEHELAIDDEVAASCGRPAIAGGLDDAHAHRLVNVPDEVGDQHDAAGQHADDGELPSFERLFDLGRHGADAVVEFLFAKQYLHYNIPCPSLPPAAYSMIFATQALINATSVPPSIARKPSRARSPRRSGAMPPTPPSWMP